MLRQSANLLKEASKLRDRDVQAACRSVMSPSPHAPGGRSIAVTPAALEGIQHLHPSSSGLLSLAPDNQPALSPQCVQTLERWERRAERHVKDGKL